MKKLILIGGTMGVGKSAVGAQLAKILPRCAFLDGDWCWTWRKDCVNDETRALVMGNILHMLRGYLRSQTYENAVFVWVMHLQPIWDEILEGLSGEEFELHRFVLTASRESYEARFMKDVEKGLREREAMEPAFARMELYDSIEAVKIPTDSMTVEETAQKLRELVEDTV